MLSSISGGSAFKRGPELMHYVYVMSRKFPKMLVLSGLLFSLLVSGQVPAFANGCGTSEGGPFDGGTGQVGTPFLISTAAQLQSIDVNACLTTGYFFELTEDVSLDGSIWTPIGTAAEFTNGGFDGGFHTISDLTVTGADAGLFGTLNGVVIKNLKIANASVTATAGQAGVLAHLVKGVTTITNIEVSDGTVVSSGRAGGLIPFTFSSSSVGISRVSVNASVSGGNDNVGGIVGQSESGTLTVADSYFAGSVQGSGNYAGGILGYGIVSSVQRTYSQGSVSGATAKNGGSVGNMASGTVSDNYYITQSAAMTSTTDGVSKTEAELQTVGTYSGWSISSDLSAMRAGTATEVWFTDAGINGGFPILNWQYANGTFDCGPGSYSSNGKAPCTVAPAGKFVATYGATIATDCPAGTYSSSQQSIACTQAEAGTFVAEPGQAAATSCQVGRYQPLAGQITCLDADAGKFVAITGSSTQTLCEAGRYQPNIGTSSCLLAEPGYFVPIEGSVVQTACIAGFSSEAGAIACFQQNFSYSGPLVLVDSQQSVAEGQTVRMTGERLSSVTAVEVQGLVVEVNLVGDSLQFVLPAGLTSGRTDLVVISSFGRLTVQGALNIAEGNQSRFASWTKNLGSGDVKMYAKNIVGAGKVQFMLNGQEIAWVRAESISDPKLREANGSHYMVRAVELVQGQKNVLEIYVDGVRAWRAAYSH